MPHKLLIADDNAAIIEVLKLNFDLLGYEVHVAFDGEEAEAGFRSFRPDLMILDVMMPKKDGYQVCRNLKSDPALSGIPIILLTAKSLKEDVFSGYDCGADAYVTKPYEPRELEQLVEQLIEETTSGRRLTAWTGLPATERILEEYKAREAAGGEVGLVEFFFPTAGVQAFIKRYGMSRCKGLIHGIAWRLKDICHRATSAGVVGQSEEDTFVCCVHPGEAQRFKAMAEREIADSIRDAYRTLEGHSIPAEEGAHETPVSEPLLSLKSRPYKYESTE